MREILFRGKRKDNGEWVQGDLVHSKTTSRGVITEIFTLGMQYEVIPETVGQFTGILDRNGRKIFDGDKVKFVDSEDGSIYSIEYHAEKTQYILRERKVFESDDIIIDTNIYIFLHVLASEDLEVVGNVADDGGAV